MSRLSFLRDEFKFLKNLDSPTKFYESHEIKKISCLKYLRLDIIWSVKIKTGLHNHDKPVYPLVLSIVVDLEDYKTTEFAENIKGHVTTAIT